MRHLKTNPIFLYKEKMSSSRSKSRLRDGIKSSDKLADRLSPANYTHRNVPGCEGLNMADQEVRIRREYSPLYQRSSQQSSLFQKGIKKSQKNISFSSALDFTLSPCKSIKDISPRTIKRRDPNRQQQSVIELGSKSPINSRSINKRDPNVQSREQLVSRSRVKDPNRESSQTADYVVKALTSHTVSKVKEIHLSFSKKENLLSKETLTNQPIQNTSEQNPNKSHKRHFSQSTGVLANKTNLQTTQSGICLKQNVQQKSRHSRNYFNHDFYRKEGWLINKENILTNRYGERSNVDKVGAKTAKKDDGERKNFKTQQQQQGVNQLKSSNRMAQLRKKFL